jgi:carbamoyltransferase
MDYFDYCVGLTMTNAAFDGLFGGPPRKSEELLTQRHMDLAASVQAVTEQIMLKLTRDLARTSGQKNLCLSGGVALNCVANGKILRQADFRNIWIQPAAGDAGGALGAALAAYHHHHAGARVAHGPLDGMNGSYLGPAFGQEETEQALSRAGAVFTRLTDSELVAGTAKALANGKAVGWFQGRMEFGPRALGNRSILGDPRSPTMQKLLNMKVKFRESFRPFAPAVLREDVADWFQIETDSPYMLLVAEVVEHKRRQMTRDEQQLFGIDKLNVVRSEIPAVTHVDYSARVQTVHRETNHRFHALISAFKDLTGCPVLVNTSFNVRGEPIVCTPEDAFRCFMGTDIEVLVCGNAILHKEEQKAELAQDYKNAFDLD